MKTPIVKLSTVLRAKGESLLDAYDPEDLHQLRVCLRRIRSYLKTRPGGKARRLRHELGKLADTTNAARDWDTLVARAYKDLGAHKIKTVRKLLLESQVEAHQPVLDMLTSPLWSDTLNKWDKYLRNHPPRKPESGSSGKSLKQTRGRVGRAWQRANYVGEPHNWHKLRIAIKDLRYRLEEQPGKPTAASRSTLLKQCKKLQAFLGDWHDTVVHRELVRDCIHQYNAYPDIEAVEVLRNWWLKMESEGQRSLDATRSSLEAPDTLIVDV